MNQRANKYQPSTEPERLSHELAQNCKRLVEYQDKHLLDVTDEQEVLPDDYQNALDNDKDYQKFISEVNDAPF